MLLCAGVCVALLVAALGDLGTADRVASVVGAVLSAVGLAVSLVQLFRAGGPGATAAAGARSVQAGGSIGRAVTGDRNRLSGNAPSPPGSGTAAASSTSGPPGERGVSAAGSIGEAVTGDDNTQS
ncbi:hypothetical protein SCNRRL3882_0170 [Streptomyces chartreusis NRRL 3882]|uniref:Uncharacterized protein n=1 Tax=Streptomyces chartreusis NRRL 3882 TaxID=1079985 RepID=A0A2N9B030_STRCX|nr:hypothetical protein SCNRRL3882_0170 [Streptomyces chartreusis NRRL 3882]